MDDPQTALMQAAARLRSKGLMREGDTLSVRLPGKGHFLCLQEKGCVTLPLASPRQGDADLHRLCYLAAATVATRNGANAYALGASGGLPGRTLCLGFTLTLLVFNVELLEKCAKACLLASTTGRPIKRVPWLVRWVAGQRLAKDRRRAAASHAAGQPATINKRY
jgi:hypothetical protein